MDFSNVKSITIPEGTVKQIQDSNGNIIWKSGYSVKVNLQANETGTIKIGSASAVSIVSGQAYDIPEVGGLRVGYTITINADSGYYLNSVLSGWTSQTSITVNGNQTQYRSMTINVSGNQITGDVEYTIPVATAYYSIDLNSSNGYASGSITFAASGYTKNISWWPDDEETLYYTGAVSVDVYFYSDYKNYYDTDGRVFTGYTISGLTSGQYTLTSSNSFPDALILDNDDTAGDTYYYYFRLQVSSVSNKSFSANYTYKDTRCVYIVNNSGVNFEFCTKDQYTPGESSIAGWSVGVSNGTSKYIVCPYSSSSYDYGTLYAFNWDYVLTEVETEDGSPSTYYMANIAYKQYTVTVYNRSSYEIVLDSYSTGKHSISAGSSKTLTYNWGTSSKFDFKKSDGSGGWSSTITYSSDSDVRSNHSLYANISTNTSNQFNWDGYGQDYTESSGEEIYTRGARRNYRGFGSWSGHNPFYRSSSSTHIRMYWNGNPYIAPIPSGMPMSWDDSSDSWDGSSATVSPTGYYIGGFLYDKGEEDREMYGFVGFETSGSFPTSYQFGTYDSVTTYSPYWG